MPKVDRRDRLWLSKPEPRRRDENSRGPIIIGPVVEGVAWHVTQGGQEEEFESMLTRLVAERPEPDPEFWADAVYLAEKMIEPANVEPLSLNEWLSRFGGPNSAKVRQLRAAWEEARNRRSNAAHDTKYRAMLKIEVKAFLVLFMDWVRARLITTIQDYLKVLEGRALVAQCRHLNSMYGHASLCGYYFEPGSSLEECAFWFIRAYELVGCIIECDFKNFDMTNSPWSALVPLLVDRILGMSPRVWRAHCAVLLPSRYTSREGVKARVRDTGTLTGHPGTTHDNSLKNLVAFGCAIISAWRNKHRPGVSFVDVLDDEECPRWGREFWLMVCGDDSLGVIRPDLVDGLREELARTGYKAKLKYGHPLQQATFCSNCLWPIENGRYCFGPQWKLLLKYGVTTTKGMELFDQEQLTGKALRNVRKHNNRARKRMLSFRRGVALGLKRATFFIPLLRDKVDSEFAATEGATYDSDYRKLGSSSVKKGEWEKYKIAQEHELQADALLWASERYAVPVGVVLDYQKELRGLSIPHPGFVGSTPPWDVLRTAIALTDGI